MASTARVRMKRRLTPNTAAQALNLLAEGEGTAAFRAHGGTFTHFSRNDPKGDGRSRVLRGEISRTRCSRKMRNLHLLPLRGR